ncbi:hypothetical protein M3N64_09780 [Sporolactobacillus sp. CPB3-1]|uniref:Uncharacterized protein n=1 Tax=Sporolactobacillus mangiferae TaxID=2940498 RepID=A0ABT0MC38_9BACL|nr:hypothetical protein [Sporolactobacillus mangiferae]MCL1632228.1 hypothetical protein [Sporolactobacillus mangiferae]
MCDYYQPLRSEHNDMSQFQMPVTAADIQNELNFGRAGQFYLTKLGNNGIILFQLLSYDPSTGNVSMNEFISQTGQWMAAQIPLSNLFGLVFLGSIFPQSPATAQASSQVGGSDVSVGSAAPSGGSGSTPDAAQILGQAESLLGALGGASGAGESSSGTPQSPGTFSIPGVPGTFPMPTPPRNGATYGYPMNFSEDTSPMQD